VKLPITGSVVRRLLIIAPVFLALTVISLFMPAQRVTIEGIGRLSFETTVTLYVGQEAARASPDETGWHSPSANEDNSNWTDPQNAYASDDAYMTTTTTGEDGATVKLYNFNISIPSGSTINGIEVGIEAKISTATGARKVRARLMYNGRANETSLKKTNPLTTSDTYYILGRPADTWGRNWSVDDFSNDNFAVRVTSNMNKDCTISFDHVRVKVYYTPPPDISNTPSSKNFGTVSENALYWSNGSPPNWGDGLNDGECYFEVTNNSSDSVDISIEAADFGGGVGWTLAGSPDVDTVTLKAGQSGDAFETDMVTLTTSDQDFISNLGASDSKKWELELETGTFTDGVEKTSTVTLIATFA